MKLSLSIAALLVLSPLSVGAQGGKSATADIDRAGQLYGEGAALYKAERYAEAAEKFAAAFELDPSPILLYNLARANELSGNADAAIEQYRTYLREYPDAEDKTEVDRRIRILEAVQRKARIATLTVEGLPEGAVLTINDAPPPPSEQPNSFQLDPGKYVVRVIAPGTDPWTHRLELAPAARETITWRQDDEKVVIPPDDAGSEDDSQVLLIAGWSSVGVGALMMGLGGFFYSEMVAAQDDFDAYRRDLPDDLGVEELALDIAAQRSAAQDDIDSNHTLSLAMFIAGGVAVATGVTLLVLDMNDGGADTEGSASVVALPGGLGVVGTF